jgi:hypothetical protein
VTRAGDVEAAVLAVLPVSAVARMHGEAVWLAVRGRIADAGREEVTGALLRLAAGGAVIRWTRFTRPGQRGIERWYRADARHGTVPVPSLFD